MVQWPMLLGDIGDIIRIALIFIFVVSPIIHQIVRSARKANEREKPRPRQQVPPQQMQRQPQRLGQVRAQRVQPQQGPPRQGALHDEVDAFLQRAAQRRQGAGAQAIEIVEPGAARHAGRPLVQAEVVDAEPVHESVSAHVQQHIQTRELEQHTQRLGAEVGHADEKVEGRLHEVFDHQLGQLGHDPLVEAPEEKTISQGTDGDEWESTGDRRQQREEEVRERVEDITSMLRNPSGLQNAVILAEILRRPEERF